MDIWDQYYLALGKFVDSFATAEDCIFAALRTTFRLSPKNSRALFSGTRCRTGMDFIRRAYEANSLPLPEILERAFAQLSAINTTRDTIIHYGATMESDGLRVSNERIAHTPKTLKSFPISPSTLDEMTEDLATITSALLVYCVDQGGKLDPRVDIPLNRQIAQRSWLYRPAQQGRSAPRTLNTTRKPKPQQQASQG